jgi:drug/metabolite transporter (DMT)-like permease
MLTALFVTLRIVANPLSNVLQKQLTRRGAHPLVVIAVTHGILTPVAVALLAAMRWDDLDSVFWINIVLCAVLAVVGNALIVYALRESDLSVLGPINAYKSVLSLVLAVVMLGEIPSVAGAVGVVLVLAGSLFVVDRAPGQAHGRALLQFIRDRGIQLRLAALVFSATEAVLLKRAILHSTPLVTFLFWSILGLPVALIAVAAFGWRGDRTEAGRWAENVRLYLGLGLTTGLMQAATLFTFEKLQVGYSLALFQLSTIVSVFFGHHFFRERNIKRRLIGSLIMVAGAMLIVSVGRSKPESADQTGATMSRGELRDSKGKGCTERENESGISFHAV